MAQSKEVRQRLDFLIKELGFKKKKGSYVFSPDGSKVFSLDVCGMHGTHGVYPVGIHVWRPPIGLERYVYYWNRFGISYSFKKIP